jgi:hypothetical protein
MRCPHYGLYNPEGAPSYARCQQELLRSRRTDSQPRPFEPQIGYGEALGLGWRAYEGGGQVTTVIPQGVWGLPRRQPDLTGTVIAADAVYYEPPDFDGIRLLNRMLFLLELLVLPFLLMAALLKFAGPFSIILGVLGLYLFFKVLSPSRLFALIGIWHFLSPGRAGEEQVPVQYFRVRDRLEREHIVRRKGRFRSGNLMPGDEVALWGRWRDGVLHLRSGLNLRTRAQIAIPQSSSWAWLVLHLVIFSMFMGLFVG